MSESVTLRYGWGFEAALPYGDITPETEVAFTRGHCHALAVALHEATGWPIYEAYYDGHLPDPDEAGGHFAVKCPDGRIVDVMGAYTEDEEAFPGWGVATWVPSDIARIQWAVNWDGYRPLEDALDLARSLVPHVLRRAFGLDKQETT